MNLPRLTVKVILFSMVAGAASLVNPVRQAEATVRVPPGYQPPPPNVLATGTWNGPNAGVSGASDSLSELNVDFRLSSGPSQIGFGEGPFNDGAIAFGASVGEPPAAFENFDAYGVYSTTNASGVITHGVVIGFAANSVNNYLGSNFDTVFSNFLQAETQNLESQNILAAGSPTLTESDVVNALLNGGSDPSSTESYQIFGDFTNYIAGYPTNFSNIPEVAALPTTSDFLTNSNGVVAANIELVNFSGGVLAGSLSISPQPVPLPGTIEMLAFGILMATAGWQMSLFGRGRVSPWSR